MKNKQKRNRPINLGLGHTSIFAWRVLWTEGPGRLEPTASQRVGHD